MYKIQVYEEEIDRDEKDSQEEIEILENTIQELSHLTACNKENFGLLEQLWIQHHALSEEAIEKIECSDPKRFQMDELLSDLNQRIEQSDQREISELK